MSEETIEGFNWGYTEFVSLMGGKAPLTMLTGTVLQHRCPLLFTGKKTQCCSSFLTGLPMFFLFGRSMSGNGGGYQHDSPQHCASFV
jgi:hypothetical protein